MSPPKQALDELRFGREYYSQADVARLLDVPVSTVGNWVRGYRYPVGDQVRSADPLIVPPQAGRWLSFANLVEAHTVAAFRAESGVSMQKIRPALAYLVRSSRSSIPWPAATCSPMGPSSSSGTSEKRTRTSW